MIELLSDIDFEITSLINKERVKNENRNKNN